MVTGSKREGAIMGKQFLLVDMNGRVWVSDRRQQYVGVVEVRTIIDLSSGVECDGCGGTPIQVAPPEKPPLDWDD
jgi:hypothetical protein